MPSYSPVFSSQFILYTDAAPNYVFDVPAGFTAVVRDFSAFTELGGLVTALNIQDSEAAPAIVCCYLGGFGAPEYQHIEGRWVVPGGGIMTLYVSSVSLATSVYVGGYLLRNTLT